MRAMKCDRCGKFYEYCESNKILFNDAGGRVNGIMLIDIDLERKHQNRKIYDLCPDRKIYDLCPECMKEFVDFLKGTQNNERL